MAASDGTLVLGVRNGDRSAFAELYDRRARLIRAVCYDTTKDVHAAADLTQEVFLRAYQNLGRLNDPQRFAGWLVGIARRVCREWRRQKLRDERKVAGFAACQAVLRQVAEPPDDRLFELREAIAAVAERERSTLPSLTDKERLALHAYYLQGRDVDEARGVLGLSRSGFYRVLSSAVDRLRRVLAKQEVQR
ncbi:MAG: sigma-70 family RNA polymerase sigma factor [Planctomycetes bacterium]|nr:sigma-70 family RNA polymerase sigma factor [Planctomycetota bacterium]